jgi:RNA polymerase sigma-70 factor (ECF subfamily)
VANEFPEDLLDAVFRFAKRLTGSDDAAADLAQDVFVRVWAKWLRPREPKALKVYLFRTAVRRWRDVRRRKQPVELPECDQPGREIPPDRAAAVNEELLEALEFLKRLPDQQRLAVHLVAVEELSLAEAASALGSTHAAVKANLSLARGKLREWAQERSLGRG